MKTATLIAIIAMGLNIAAALYFLLLNNRVIEYNPSLNSIVQTFFLLSDIGLLIFFIILYQKQSKN
jgi:hypothetical protein